MNKKGLFILIFILCLAPLSAFGEDTYETLQRMGMTGTPMPDTYYLKGQTDLPPEAVRMLPADIQEKIREVQEQRLSAPVPSEKNGKTEQAIAEEGTQLAEEVVQEDEKEEVEVSTIEKQYREGYRSDYAENLSQFGYKIFDTAAIQSSRLVVPEDKYVIGPGDTLNIRFWGSGYDGDFTKVVATDGNIDIPRIGVLKIAGVKLGNAANVIRQEAEKYVQGINIHVSLTELRSVEVFVVGAVNNPGLQVVPAFSTVMSGLLSAGGVHKSGTLRTIELYRNNKLHLTLDLYELLLEGNREFDIMLENNDVIHVPRIKKTAAVAGAVNNQAIFEINQEKTIGELVALAGGILPQAFTGRIHLRRFVDNREFVVQDLDAKKQAQQWQAVSLESGDMVEIRVVPAEWPETVELTGNVKTPDVFQYKEGMMLSEILTSRDLLKKDSLIAFGHIYRIDTESTQTTIKQFPLNDLFAGTFDLALQPFDNIVILSREEMEIIEEVDVQGAVWKPGKFEFRPGMTLADAFSLAGGGRFGSQTEKIEVSRQIVNQDQVMTNHLVLDLKNDGGYLLKPFDYIFVPMIKDATVIQTVTLTGEVKFPGQYRIKTGERVSSVIERAGGFTGNAYFYGAMYTSEKARIIQQESINRMILNLEVESQRILGEEAQTALSSADVAAAKAAQTTVQTMLDRIRRVRAEGRVAIQLAGLDLFRDTEFDFEMENGDTLNVPKRPNFVAVVGSVYNPSAYLWEDGMTLSTYLAKSGGPTKSADEKEMYVIKANGEVFSKNQTTHFDSIALMPGDTIVVPENLERIPYLRLVKDIADIVFKIAVTVGVLVAIL